VGNASVSLRFVGHATVLIDVGGFRILTDPFLRGRLGPLERHGPPPDVEGLGEIDVVLISHGHPDHFDRASLAAVLGRPVTVVPRGLGGAIPRVATREVIETSAGDRFDIDRVTIRAVPARHWISPGSPRARPLGYVIDVGTRIYFAGDTGRTPSMLDLERAVDVALLPVWTWGPHLGPGHLGPRSAAEVLRDIRPRIAVPIHWGTLYPRRLHRVW
jgi:L-ascorbate metabolism protein UlaG (beta-lactamase superfamily)